MRCLIVGMLILAIGAPAIAQDIKLTIYDDGRSCPADCDAHFVMNTSDNGTSHAFRPGSSRQNPEICLSGKDCRICFGEADDSCMTALYRGGGPHAGTFDFTPAFYDANCPRADIPAALRKECRRLDGAVRAHGYQNRINCFEKPDHPKCQTVVTSAKAAQQKDEPKRKQCLQMGEVQYNKEQTDGRQRRSNDCNYSALSLGGTNGRKWRLLLPAACRPGTYVDRFGLDCCSGNLRFAASIHPECTAFFPTR